MKAHLAEYVERIDISYQELYSEVFTTNFLLDLRFKKAPEYEKILVMVAEHIKRAETDNDLRDDPRKSQIQGTLQSLFAEMERTRAHRRTDFDNSEL